MPTTAGRRATCIHNLVHNNSKDATILRNTGFLTSLNAGDVRLKIVKAISMDEHHIKGSINCIILGCLQIVYLMVYACSVQ